MATELSSFAELKKAAPAAAGTQVARRACAEKEVDAQGRAYATGRRKNAVARVWVKPGTGQDHHQRPRPEGLLRAARPSRW